MILHILDKNEISVGVLSNDAPFSCPFYDDKHTENIRMGTNSFEFTVPAGHEMASRLEMEGSVIFPNLDNQLQIFKIKNIEEVTNDTEYIKRITTEHTAISDLLVGGVVRPFEYELVDLETIMSIILDGTGYALGDFDYTQHMDLKIESYSTVLEVLYKVAESFQVEVQFETIFKQGKIVDKLIHMKEKLGTVTNNLFVYSKDIDEVVRNENSEAVITALIGVGKGDSDGNQLTLENHNPAELPDGFTKELDKDYIVSESALQSYGTNGKHKFGIYISDTAITKDTLAEETVKQLLARQFPYITYEMKVVTLERVTGYSANKVRVGDTINAKDTSMNPTLMIEARVLEITRSVTNPEDDELVLGDYKPVKINAYDDIDKIRQAIIANEEKWASGGVSIPEVEEVVNGKIEPIERDLDDVKEEVKDKEYAIIRQDEMPEGVDFYMGRLWIDGDDFIYTWTGTEWKKLISVSLDDIGGVDADEFESKVTDLEKDYIAKIDKATKDTKKDIDDINTDIAGKVGAEYVDGKLKLKANAEDVFTKVETETKLGEKADSSITYTKQDVDDALDNKVSSTQFTTDMEGVITDLNSQESRIQQTEKGLESKVSSTDYVQRNEKVDKDISSVETTINEANTAIEQTNKAIKLKANTEDIYTKSQVDTSLSGKAGNEEVKTVETLAKSNKSALTVQADEIKAKVSSEDYSEKMTQVDSAVKNKADSKDVYTKGETDTKVGTKADTSTVTKIETRLKTAETSITETDKAIKLKANTSDIYTKTQVDGELKDKADDSDVKLLESRIEKHDAEFTVQADEIKAKVSSSDYSKKVSEIDTSVGKKANTADVYKKTEVDTKVNAKADTSKVTAVETRMKTAETSITQTDKDIKLKANSSDVYTKTQSDGKVSTAVSTAKAGIKVTTDAITQSVSKVNETVSGHTKSITEQTASIKNLGTSIETEVSKVQADLDGLEIGGRNLLADTSDDERDFNLTGFNGHSYKVIGTHLEEMKKGGFFTISIDITKIDTISGDSGVSLSARGTTGTAVVQYHGGWISDDTPTKIIYTIKLPDNSSRDEISYYDVVLRQKNSNQGVFKGKMRKLQLEKGNKATPWREAPEDTQKQIDAHNTTIKSNTTRISQTEKDITSTVKSTQHKADIEGLTSRMKTAETSIKQTEKDITSTVKTTDYTGAKLVSMINQTASTVTIAAKNIDLKGSVTVLSDITGKLGSITAGDISGVNITGATIKQSSAGGSIELNDKGFYMKHKSGTPRISMESLDGADLYSSLIEFEKSTKPNHFAIGTNNKSLGDGFVGFVNSNADRVFRIANPGGRLTIDSKEIESVGKLLVNANGEAIQLRPASSGAGHAFISYMNKNSDRTGYVGVSSGTYGDDLRFNAERGRAWIQGLGQVIIDAGTGHNFFVNYDSIGSKTIYERTYTASSQMVRVTVNGILGRSTSSRRYKLVEEPITKKLNPYSLLDIKPKSWYDKRAAEEYSLQLETGKECEVQPIERIAGLIAEDVHDAGLGIYVTYNEEGVIDGISENLWNLLIPITADHERKIKELQEEVNKLKGEM